MMMIFLDLDSKEEIAKRILEIQKSHLLVLVDLEDSMMMMISLVVVVWEWVASKVLHSHQEVLEEVLVLQYPLQLS
jgi:hypothetical protein